MICIEDRKQMHIPLSTAAKAKCLLMMLKEKAGFNFDAEFTTHFAWFKRFVIHYIM